MWRCLSRKTKAYPFPRSITSAYSSFQIKLFKIACYSSVHHQALKYSNQLWWGGFAWSQELTEHGTQTEKLIWICFSLLIIKLYRRGRFGACMKQLSHDIKKMGFRNCNTFHYMIVAYLTYLQQIKANPTEAYIMLSATDADKYINKSWSSLEFLNQYLVPDMLFITIS